VNTLTFRSRKARLLDRRLAGYETDAYYVQHNTYLKLINELFWKAKLRAKREYNERQLTNNLNVGKSVLNYRIPAKAVKVCNAYPEQDY
jgi:hypothetical protein